MRKNIYTFFTSMNYRFPQCRYISMFAIGKDFDVGLALVNIFKREPASIESLPFGDWESGSCHGQRMDGALITHMKRLLDHMMNEESTSKQGKFTKRRLMDDLRFLPDEEEPMLSLLNLTGFLWSQNTMTSDLLTPIYAVTNIQSLVSGLPTLMFTPPSSFHYPGAFGTSTKIISRDLIAGGVYSWENRFIWNPITSNDFSMTSELGYKSPEFEVSLISTSLRKEMSSQRTLLHFKGEGTRPKLKIPLKIDFTWMTAPESLSVVLQTNDSPSRSSLCSSTSMNSFFYKPKPKPHPTPKPTPSKIFEWEVTHSYFGGLQWFNVTFDLASVKKVMDEAANLVRAVSGNAHIPDSEEDSDEELDASDSGSEEGQSCLHGEESEQCDAGKDINLWNFPMCSRYHQLDFSTYALIIQSPYRTVESLGKYSESEVSFEVYPNRAESESKYAVSARSSLSFIGTKYEGCVSHPSLNRDMRGEVEYRTRGHTHEGSFELDVLPDPADKLTGFLHCTLIANDTINIKGTFTTRVLSFPLDVSAIAASTNHTIAVDFVFLEHWGPDALRLKLKLDQMGCEDGPTFAAHVSGQQGTMVEVTGFVGETSGPRCQGIGIEAATFTSVLGRRDFLVSLCSPGLLKVVSRVPGEEWSQAASFGLRNPYQVECSVYRTSEDETQMVFLARLGPTLPFLDVIIRTPHLYHWQEEIKQDLFEIAHSLDNWVEQGWEVVVNEVQFLNITFPPPAVAQITHQIQRDMTNFTRDVQARAREQYAILRRFWHAPDLRLVKEMGFKYWLLLRSMESELNGDYPRLYTDKFYWLDEVRHYNFLISAVATELVEMIESGAEDLRTSIQHVLDWIHSTRVYQLAQADIVEALKQILSPAKAEFVTEVAKKVLVELEDDMAPLKGNPSLVWFTVAALKRVDSVVKSVTLKPVSTLTNLLWDYNSHASGPVTNLGRIYYTLLLPHFTDHFQPSSQSAWVLGGTHIMTFDGDRFQVPMSPCRVILAACGNGKVTMSHPNITSTAPEVIVTTPEVTVVIKNNTHVQVNGRVIKNIDITLYGVTVHTSGLQNIVILPCMKIRVATALQLVMVEASGWAYGRLAGLLGTFDGEISNDWLLSTGIQATSVSDFVASWQENESCYIPSLQSISNPTLERRMHCYPLLGVWNRCNGIVRPEPYMNMCYVTANPCEAAQAYRSVCTTRGVTPLFSRGC